MNKLSLLYEELHFSQQLSTHKSFFRGRLVKGFKKNVIVCKDKNNHPFILVKNKQQTESTKRYRLQNLKIEHQKFCKIYDGTNSISGVFSIITLTSDEQELKNLFFDILYPIIQKIKVPSEPAELDKKLDQLIELFKYLNKRPLKTASGLWSELYLIYKSQDPRKCLKYWHQNPNNLYDFSLNNNHVEIKSTLSDSRKHFFSIYQAYPQGNPIVLIASVLLSRLENGLSLFNLKEKIKIKLDNDQDSISKLERIFYETLGDSWKEASKESFDENFAGQNIAFFDLQEIPKLDVNQKEIRGLSEITFRSNLSSINQIKVVKYRVKSELFKILTK